MTTYSHGTIKDYVANWQELGLNGEHPCLYAAAEDGARALVPYSPEFREHATDAENHLRRVADEKIAELRAS